MDNCNLHLKLQLVEPPLGYAFCLQRGKGSKSERLDYIEVDRAEDSKIEFELEVTVKTAKSSSEPDFFGPYVQGTVGARFFYLCVGNLVRDGEPQWAGRVKIPFTGIDWPKVDAATNTNCYLFARYRASNDNGGPVFASVKLLYDGWAVHHHNKTVAS